jgi:RNA polymerase sigma-70 factor, ECF subfamily
MSQGRSFSDLIAKLHEGDEDAATEVFNRFAQQLAGKARNRLDTIMQKKVDPEDIVQSVYRSFFTRQKDGQFQLENWESLWGLLLTITMRKCGRKIDHFHTDKRDVFRESSPVQKANESTAHWELMDREPTPDEVAMLTETLQQMMLQLNEQQREILTLSLQGYTREEVAEQIKCSERTVRRVLKFLKEDLEKMNSESD